MEEEIAQEAAAAGMTVEEYAANGYEPVSREEAPEQAQEKAAVRYYPIHENAARDRNMQEWQDVQGLLDKIRSTGMGRISADDPQAVQKLEAKLASLVEAQENMKAINAYYRKHGTLDGCTVLPEKQIQALQQDMKSSWHLEPKPFQSFELSNNNAEIRRTRARIEELKRHGEKEYSGWTFDGGRVEANKEANRLQIFFDGKPDEATSVGGRKVFDYGQRYTGIRRRCNAAGELFEKRGNVHRAELQHDRRADQQHPHRG